MTRLSALDSAFLLLDRPRRPCHVAYLNLLTPPQNASGDFVQRIFVRLRGHGDPQTPFNRHVQHGRFGLYWNTDDDFDPAQHLVHLILPPPGRMRDLMQAVARLHAAPLDRNYPMWRIYLIEGLADGRLATYSQLHHSVADGIAATRLVMKSMSKSSHAIAPPIWAIPPAPVPQGRSVSSGMFTNIRRQLLTISHSLGSLPGAGREVRHTLRAIWSHDPAFVTGHSAPASILNQRISGSRRYVAGTFSLPRFKTLARALACTVNDLVLAISAAALRDYLLDANALPDKPLVAGVPHSLRRDASESGNQIVFLLVDLGTDLADDLQRFERIKRSVEQGKQRYARMTSAEIVAYNFAMLAPAGVNLLCGFNPRWQPFNVVISNTPGPRTALYWQGCRLDAMYPVSLLTDGQALNISLTRRHDSLDFGVLACRRLPSIEPLLDNLERGLASLERAVLCRADSEMNSSPQLIRSFFLEHSTDLLN